MSSQNEKSMLKSRIKSLKLTSMPEFGTSVHSPKWLHIALGSVNVNGKCLLRIKQWVLSLPCVSGLLTLVHSSPLQFTQPSSLSIKPLLSFLNAVLCLLRLRSCCFSEFLCTRPFQLAFDIGLQVHGSTSPTGQRGGGLIRRLRVEFFSLQG